jgi:RNA polymerase sigma-70 factor (ECF subfamily)
MHAVSSPRPAQLDHVSQSWLDSLTSDGSERDQAVSALHALLVRAARFEISRRSSGLNLSSSDFSDLALESADDALMAVLSKLDSFRGDSRFTTWAYKFAVLEAAVRARRRRWQDRVIPTEVEGFAALSDAADLPETSAERREFLSAIKRAITDGLSPHQRRVLVALTLNDVPIDVLAERLGTTRGALYKTLHDARLKLRRDLSQQGFHLDSGDQ